MTPHHTMVTRTAQIWIMVCPAMEKSASPVPPSQGAVKMPVPIAPTMPPTPWMPKTSRLSS